METCRVWFAGMPGLKIIAYQCPSEGPGWHACWKGRWGRRMRPSTTRPMASMQRFIDRRPDRTYRGAGACWFMLPLDIQELIWRTYFRRHVLDKVPHSRLSPAVLEAFERVKKQRLYGDKDGMYEVWTGRELEPVMDWVPAVLRQGGSWYFLAEITDRDVLGISIIVHGTSGALAYHEHTLMASETISVSTVSLFDIVEHGYRENFSITMDRSDFWMRPGEWQARRFRHYLKRQIGADCWLDTRELCHVHHKVGYWYTKYDRLQEEGAEEA